jgi:hypothetical protein
MAYNPDTMSFDVPDTDMVTLINLGHAAGNRAGSYWADTCLGYYAGVRVRTAC